MINGKKDIKFRVLLPYECLFDLRWGFIRAYSGMSDIDLFPRFNDYCARLTDDLTTIVPTLDKSFSVTPDVVRLAPRTAILTLVTNTYRQFASEHPDNNVTMHITLNFAGVELIPKEVRQNIVEMMKLTLQGTGAKVHVVHDVIEFGEVTIKKLRKKFDCLIIYSLQEFVTHYNTQSRMAYQGLGIITRPLFRKGKRPEDFHKLINSRDKRNVKSGTELDPGDHYDIASDAFSHIGPIYFHEPQFFSAITPK